MTPDHKLSLPTGTEDESKTTSSAQQPENVSWANSISVQMPLEKEEARIKNVASAEPQILPEEEPLFSMAPFYDPHPQKVASIRESIGRALNTDEPFTFFISTGETRYLEMPLFDAIQALRCSGELNEIEALELSHYCKEAMEKAAKINYRANPVDQNQARKQHRLSKKRTLFLPVKTTVFQELLNETFETLKSGLNRLTMTDSGFAKVPIMEAIFWERQQGKITDRELMILFKVCVWSMGKNGRRKLFRLLKKLKINDLIKGSEEIKQFVEILGLDIFEKLEFKKEIEALLETKNSLEIKRKPPLISSVRKTVKQSTDKILRPNFDVSIIVTGTRASAVALMATVALVAGAMSLIGDSTGEEHKSASLSGTKTKPKSPASPFPEVAPLVPHKPQLPVASSGTATAQERTSLKKAPMNPEKQSIKPLASETRPTPAKSSIDSPKPSSTEAQQIAEKPAPAPSDLSAFSSNRQEIDPAAISIPIVTKPGPFGKARLDEVACKKLWENEGFEVRIIPGKGGGKAFKLSKNGKIYIINPADIHLGLTTMEINPISP